MVFKPPISREHTCTEGCEKLEETPSKVKTPIRATRALVGDSGRSLLIADLHDNFFEAVGTGVATTVLGGIQSNDILVRRIDVATGASSSSNIIESPASATESFVQLNVTFGTLRNIGMSTSPAMTMAQVAKDSQRRGEGEKGDTKTH